MSDEKEIFVSVDVETAGPIPGEYSLLSIGACNAYNETQTFSCELKPTSDKYVPEAMAATGLSLAHLQQTGLDVADAMQKFSQWATSLCQKNQTLVFVGFNAAFDWAFINFYFHKYLGQNPFGFTALDIKSLYMGSTGSSWSDTRSSRIEALLMPAKKGDHQALHDAIYQAELFRLIRARQISN